MSAEKFAVIVAGGSGSRMGSNQPKQFLEINNLPILMHTLKAFHDFNSEIQLIVVLPNAYFKIWKELCEKHQFEIHHEVIEGGDTRFESSKNGLQAINREGLVAIHDGARPLVSSEVISETFESAEKYGNGIAAVPLKDSIREITESENKNVDREKYFAIQTPQTFRISLIKQAFEHADPQNNYTDDASVLEDLGEKINLTQGSYKNIKVTTPEDLIVAEALLDSSQ